jgi:uncharacterized protein (DUF433 family)
VVQRHDRWSAELAPGVIIMEAMATTLTDRITIDPEVLAGKPIIRGTRLSVGHVLSLLASGWSQEQVLANYPGLSAEDIQACLRYAAETLQAEKVYPLQS